MKEIREEPNKWRYFMYIDRKTQYCQGVCNHNDDITKLLSGYGQTDSRVYMERQEIQSRQLNIEGEEQCWKTDTTLLQYLR